MMRAYNLTSNDGFFRKTKASQKSNAKFITKAILKIRKCNGYETDLGKDPSLDRRRLELTDSCNVVFSYPSVEALTNGKDAPTMFATTRDVVTQIDCTAKNYQDVCTSVVRDFTKAFNSADPQTPNAVFQHVISTDCDVAFVDAKNKIGARLRFIVQTIFKYKGINNDHV